jgi:hypothetical protein
VQVADERVDEAVVVVDDEVALSHRPWHPADDELSDPRNTYQNSP